MKLPFFSKKSPKPTKSNSFSSTSSSSTTPSTPSTVLPRPRPVIGRNASCLDVEYWTPSLPNPLSTSDLTRALTRLGSGPDDVAALLAEADRDGDGRIGVDDLHTLAVEEDELRVAFGVYDSNGDGKISAEELWEVFRLIGDESCSVEDCRRMIGGVDSDGDGFVCFEEFAKMMMAVR